MPTSNKFLAAQLQDAIRRGHSVSQIANTRRIRLDDNAWWEPPRNLREYARQLLFAQRQPHEQPLLNPYDYLIGAPAKENAPARYLFGEALVEGDIVFAASPYPYIEGSRGNWSLQFLTQGSRGPGGILYPGVRELDVALALCASSPPVAEVKGIEVNGRRISTTPNAANERVHIDTGLSNPDTSRISPNAYNAYFGSWGTRPDNQTFPNEGAGWIGMRVFAWPYRSPIPAIGEEARVTSAIKARLYTSGAGFKEDAQGKVITPLEPTYGLELRRRYNPDLATSPGRYQTATLHWTEKNAGEGLCWAHVTLRQDPVGAATYKTFLGYPRLRFHLRGQLHLTAECIMWWLRHRMGVPLAEIDTESYNAANTFCGELVRYHPDQAATQPRYTVDGVVASEDDPLAVLREMERTWLGKVVRSGGKFYFKPGAQTTMVEVAGVPTEQSNGRNVWQLSEDDVLSIDAVTISADTSNLANSIDVKLQSPLEADGTFGDPWTAQRLVDGPARAAQGEDILMDMGELRFASSRTFAVWSQHVALRQLRSQGRWSLRLRARDDLSLLGIQVGDYARVTLGEIGLSNSLGYVENVDLPDPRDWTINVQLREITSPNEFAVLQAADEVDPEAADRRLLHFPDYGQPAAPASVTVNPEISTLDDGATRGILQVSWTIDPDKGLQPVEITVTGPGGTTIRRTVTNPDQRESIPIDEAGEYKTEVRTLGRSGKSEAVETDTAVAWPAPTDRLVLVPPFLSSAGVYTMRLRGLTQRDDGAVEIRYRLRTAGQTIDTTIPTQAQMNDLPELLTSPVPSFEIGGANTDTLYRFTVPESGLYVLFAQVVNRAGEKGPITSLGQLLATAFRLVTQNREYGPAWAGTHMQTDVMLGDEPALVQSIRPPDTVTAAAAFAGQSLDELDGKEGWPFAEWEPVGTWNPGAIGFLADTIDLGAASRAEVTPGIEYVTPPGTPSTGLAAVAGGTHKLVVYGSNALADLTPEDATGLPASTVTKMEWTPTELAGATEKIFTDPYQFVRVFLQLDAGGAARASATDKWRGRGVRQLTIGVRDPQNTGLVGGAGTLGALIASTGTLPTTPESGRVAGQRINGVNWTLSTRQAAIPDQGWLAHSNFIRLDGEKLPANAQGVVFLLLRDGSPWGRAYTPFGDTMASSSLPMPTWTDNKGVRKDREVIPITQLTWFGHFRFNLTWPHDASGTPITDQLGPNLSVEMYEWV